MKPSKKLLFRAETLDGLVLYFISNCLGEALFKAEEYVDEHHKEDLVEDISIVHGHLLEDEEGDEDFGDTEEKEKKLALVVGRIEGKKDET